MRVSYVEIQEAFNLFDKNGDGTISVKELRESMQLAGHNTAEEIVKELLKSHDKDGMFLCVFTAIRGVGICWLVCFFICWLVYELIRMDI